MTGKAVFFLANGFEELEAVAPIDVFRRAGVETVLCAVTQDGSLGVTGSHGLRVTAECLPAALPPPDGCAVVYLPGGMPGSTTLAATEAVLDYVRRVHAAGGLVCAICAAPLALDAAGLLDGVEFTCYPGVESHIRHGKYTGRYIQRDGRLMTACGPAAALDFGLEILRACGMGAAAGAIATGMQLRAK